MESSPRPEPVRIFLIGLSEALARSVARYVSGDLRVILTGVAPSLELAGMLVPGTRADLAVLDWAVLNGSAPDAVNRLRHDRPELCIFLAANQSEPYRDAAALAGAEAVISKDAFAEEFEPLLRGFFPGRFGEPGGRNG